MRQSTRSPDDPYNTYATRRPATGAHRRSRRSSARCRARSRRRGLHVLRRPSRRLARVHAHPGRAQPREGAGQASVGLDRHGCVLPPPSVRPARRRPFRRLEREFVPTRLGRGPAAGRARGPDIGRTRDGVSAIVEDSLAAGTRAIQLRDKQADAARLLETARQLRSLTRRFGALLFVNDRLDVALAAEANGVHLGPDDLPVAAVRAHVPRRFLDRLLDRRYGRGGPRGGQQGRTTWDAARSTRPTARRTPERPSASSGSTVWRAPSTFRCWEWGASHPPERGRVARTPAAGVAVIGAVMGAPDPAGAVRALLAPFIERRDV